MNETSLPKLTVQEHKANEWNKQFPKGTKVRRYRALYPRREPFDMPFFTAGPAYVVDGHTTVIRLDGFDGCVNIEALEVLEIPEKKEPVKEAPKAVPTAPKINPPKVPA